MRSTVRRSRRALFPLATLLPVVLGPAPAAAQTPDTTDATVYEFFHGSRGDSRVMAPDGMLRRLQVAPYHTVASVSNKVCVRVVNPHPGLYRYSLKPKVDSSKVEYLPKEAAQLIAVLEQVLPIEPAPAQAGGGARFTRSGRPSLSSTVPPADPNAWIHRFNMALDTLATEIKAVQQAVVTSDQFGRLENGGGVFQVEPRNETEEFGAVQRRIRSLRTTPNHFGSTKLEEELDQLYKEALGKIPRETSGPDQGKVVAGAQVMLDALRDHGRTLLTIRNALVDTYKSDPDVLLCEDVGRGRATTFNFHIQPRDTAKSALLQRRRAYDTLPVFRVRAASRFARSTLELIPIGLLHHSPDAPEYVLESDTIRLRSESTTGFRLGGMLVMNSLRFGGEDEFALGPGLGFGIGGEGKLLSDYLGAALVSFRDVLRLGVGAGYSTLPTRLIGGTKVDQARPADAKDLEDVLEDRREFSTYLIFSITGLKLPVPLPGS